MKVFHCSSCQQLVFFENTVCVSCGHRLAFAPDIMGMVALDAADDGSWRLSEKGHGHSFGKLHFRLCDNYLRHGVCNWAIGAEDPGSLCRSCRLTQIIPDLRVPGNEQAWAKLEAAKRRLIYTLMQLQLPIRGREQDPENGLAYRLLADTGDTRLLTGHADGIITLNIAEADAAERERRRLQLHEPYRTLLGHFRHEIGHFYWAQLIGGSSRLGEFRRLFGDERADYEAALRRHYDIGPPQDWQQYFISSYATAHPWEDWAESWAHYLHMTDMLETAAAAGLSLHPARRDEPAMRCVYSAPREGFERLIESWHPLTYLSNNLNRSMGMGDAYPFVLSSPATAKLHFIHDVIGAS